jgi:hypothetical protein
MGPSIARFRSKGLMQSCTPPWKRFQIVLTKDVVLLGPASGAALAAVSRANQHRKNDDAIRCAYAERTTNTEFGNLAPSISAQLRLIVKEELFNSCLKTSNGRPCLLLVGHLYLPGVVCAFDKPL